MGCILMQSDNSPESLAAIKHSIFTGKYPFDYIPSSPRLIHVLFNYRSNLEHKIYYHFFVGKITCDRWDISRLHKYLAGK